MAFGRECQDSTSEARSEDAGREPCVTRADTALDGCRRGEVFCYRRGDASVSRGVVFLNYLRLLQRFEYIKKVFS